MNQKPIFILAIGFTLSTMAGCASYEPKPLDTAVHYPKEIRLTGDFSSSWPASIRSHRFDPSDGLDIDELAMLAIANNPQLKVARDQAGEAHAQAYAAGLLPDPQINFSQDYPTQNKPGSNTTAYNAGIGFDVTSLILRSSRRKAANNESRKADLDLLWQEWQIASQARLLFTRIQALEQQDVVLQDERHLFETRYRHSRQAYEAHNRTMDAASADLAALQNVSQRLYESERQLSTARHDLNALLGLAPETRLQLAASPSFQALDEKQVTRELEHLSSRRPDLLALHRGYEAQEARLRGAVLSQFQPIGLAFNLARDTSAIMTTGFALNLVLPLFNRNQGGIAVETATRQRLYDEYSQRLLSAHAEVHQLLADGKLIESQLSEVQAGLQDALRTSQQAELAFADHNLDEMGYVQLTAATADKRIQEILLTETLTEQRIALQALLGGDLPVVNSN